MAQLRFLSRRAMSFGVVIAVVALMYSSGWNQQNLTSLFWTSFLNYDTTCEKPNYTARIISYDPLIMHLEDFITTKERLYLRDLALPIMSRSRVGQGNKSAILSSGRTSSSALLPLDDPIVGCINERVSEFQGYENLEHIEPLQVVQYQKDQRYWDHYDWYAPEYNLRHNRMSTFFGILEADCDNCTTDFPIMEADWSGQDERWCRIVDCKADILRVLPSAGSALFWRNLLPDGTGDIRVLHSGSQLTRGSKIGLNIWTWTGDTVQAAAHLYDEQDPDDSSLPEEG